MTTCTSNGRWHMLFDGVSLEGWTTGHPDHGWSVDHGMLCCTPGKRQYLYTEKTYEDFMLSLEFKIEPGVNSGVFLRCSDVNDPVNTGLEIQILDTYGQPEITAHSCGALYDLVAPRTQAVKPAGEWNTLVVACDGPLVAVVLNGEPVAEMNLDLWTEPGRNPDGTPNKFTYAWRDLPRRGHIMFQDYGANTRLMWFRNIKLKELR